MLTLLNCGRVNMSPFDSGFIIQVKTDNTGTSADNQFTIPTNSGVYLYDYDVKTSDGQLITNNTGDLTITFPSAGTYDVKITGDFPYMNLGCFLFLPAFPPTTDVLKLTDIKQWGNIVWQSFKESFYNAQNLIVSATDSPILSNVTDMSSMFYMCSLLNSNFDNWDVSNVVNMSLMFSGCNLYNQPLNSWDVSSVTNMNNMFSNTIFFNQPLNSWDVGSVTNFGSMFGYSNFNQPLDSWDVSSGLNFNGMFQYVVGFNQPLNSWVFSASLTELQYVFRGCTDFNQPLNSWNVSNIVTMNQLFFGCSSFNQNIDNWNVSSLEKMPNMFGETTVFNQPLNSWSVSNVWDFTDVFNASAFNQPLNLWNTSSGSTFAGMFRSNVVFNQDIGGWNMSSAENLNSMFNGTTSFNQDISSWDVNQVTGLALFMAGVTLSSTNYDALLVAWDAQGAMSFSGTADFGFSEYCSYDAQISRTSLISKWGAISDGGLSAVCPLYNPYKIQVKTDNAGTSTNTQFTIPTGTGVFDYDVRTSDGQKILDNTGDLTITFPTAGTYDIEIIGDFPHIKFNNSGDKLKLLEVKKWGNINWQSFNSAFYGCNNLFFENIDYPNLSSVTNCDRMFYNCNLSSPNLSYWDVSTLTSVVNMFAHNTNFNSDISGWDVSSVQNFSFMFNTATAFNQDISSWDVASALNMRSMFQVSSFNQDISSWDVSSVTDMSDMFSGNTVFNQPLNSWDVSSVINMHSMFHRAVVFNQPLKKWNVSSVTNMSYMFAGQTSVPTVQMAFNQDISSWSVNQVTNFSLFMSNCKLSSTNYDALLVAWDAQGAMSFTGTVDFGFSEYCSYDAQISRTSLISKWGAISDGGLSAVCPLYNPYKIQVKTDNAGTSTNTQFTIPTGTGVFDYDVRTSDGQKILDNTGDLIITFPTAGTYDIEITGDFPHIQFSYGGDYLKFLDIKQWGNIAWESFFESFYGCSNLINITATDTPDLSSVTDLSYMFSDATSLITVTNINTWDVSNIENMSNLFYNANSFNQNIGSWVVTSVTDMSSMFESADIFNQDISGWNVSNVTDMSWMFANQSAFNQDISGWTTTSVTNMYAMFRANSVFNQSIGGWNTSGVLNMGYMFFNTTSFNQDISSWDVNQVNNFTSFMDGVTLSIANYDALLVAWDSQGVMAYSGTTDFGLSKYCSALAEASRTSLISKWGGISDGGKDPSCVGGGIVKGNFTQPSNPQTNLSNTYTFTHDQDTGTNGLLTIAVMCNNADSIPSVTYDGVAMVQSGLSTMATSSSSKLYMFTLASPSTGVNNVVITGSGAFKLLRIYALSFTGATMGTLNVIPSTGVSPMAEVYTGVLEDSVLYGIAQWTATGGTTSVNIDGVGSKEYTLEYTWSGFGIVSSPLSAGNHTMNFNWNLVSEAGAGVIFEIQKA